MQRASRRPSTVALVVIVIVVIAAIVFLFLPVDVGDDVQGRGELLATVLAASALLVGSVALLLIARVQGPAFQAEVRFREDLAVLLAALRQIRDWIELAPSVLGRRPDAALVQQPRAAIRRVLQSSTGNTLHEWATRTPEWRLLSTYFLEILESDDMALVASRATRTYELLRGVAEASDVTASSVTEDAPIIEQTVEQTVEQIHAEAGGRANAPDDAAFARLLTFRAIRDAGVDDPEVDMFIAVLSPGDAADALNDALHRGADLGATDLRVLTRHAETTRALALRVRGLIAEGVDDPDVAMWHAALNGRPSEVRLARERGADPESSVVVVLDRHTT
jgi:hypothetical protein